MEKYYTLGGEGFAEYKILESKFMAYAYPIKTTEEFKERFRELKKLHPKANHHCFAYRLGLDGNNSRSSDDREPSGTAGRPILGQIDSKELTDTLIVVVRYFGGILLGIPRLTAAYKTAASLVLQCTTVVERHVLTPVSIECNYPELHEVLQILRQTESEITHQDLQLFCHIDAGIPISEADRIIEQLRQINNVLVNTK